MEALKKAKRLAGLFFRTWDPVLTRHLDDLGEQGRAISLSLNYPASIEALLGIKKGAIREKIMELLEDRPFLDHINSAVARAAVELKASGMKGTVGVFNYGPLLYALVRIFQPSIMVETGVASGTSSACTLRAMDRNGKGKLISIDLPMGDTVDPKYMEFQFKRKGGFGPTLVPPALTTGYAIPESLKSRWRLILGDAKLELPRALSEAGQIDVFMHDSEHSYEHMMFEFETAYPHLRKGAILLSDDVSWNDSFRDFAKKVGRPCETSRIGILVK